MNMLNFEYVPSSKTEGEGSGENKEKVNILIAHGTLDGASLEDKEYNSIPKKMLAEKGFDYVALGHIHKTNYMEKIYRDMKKKYVKIPRKITLFIRKSEVNESDVLNTSLKEMERVKLADKSIAAIVM